MQVSAAEAGKEICMCDDVFMNEGRLGQISKCPIIYIMLN
jgi:hypothetical protein